MTEKRAQQVGPFPKSTDRGLGVTPTVLDRIQFGCMATDSALILPLMTASTASKSKEDFGKGAAMPRFWGEQCLRLNLDKSCLPVDFYQKPSI